MRGVILGWYSGCLTDKVTLSFCPSRHLLRAFKGKPLALLGLAQMGVIQNGLARHLIQKECCHKKLQTIDFRIERKKQWKNADQRGERVVSSILTWKWKKKLLLASRFFNLKWIRVACYQSVFSVWLFGLQFALSCGGNTSKYFDFHSQRKMVRRLCSSCRLSLQTGLRAWIPMFFVHNANNNLIVHITEPFIPANAKAWMQRDLWITKLWRTLFNLTTLPQGKVSKFSKNVESRRK